MARQWSHEGKVSFWDGRFRTYCGMTVPVKETTKLGWFFRRKPSCTECLAWMRMQKGRR
ncbi:hypothetical protein HUW46_09554 (plasmid) [Amycolatopsis sp. CA-230715]|nr:hypothetical protein HUW46_09554 [Amycolatopsis sp. CA-230715]